MAAQKQKGEDNGGVNNEEESVINRPSHYQGLPHGLQVVDIAEAVAAQDLHLGTAVIYLLRAGKKDNSSYTEDVAKAIWWLKRGIKFHGGHPEVDTSDV